MQAKYNKPPFRKLKGYAFDPSLSLKIDTAAINQLTYKVIWEDVKNGPIGEYLEVIDFDPTTKLFYTPVDLNNEYILAQDGLEPSESNPMFHQQMVYAVAMTTIINFEKALGRKIIWSPRQLQTPEFEEYVDKLRIYPHALREANAYYSPHKKALLFGYFPASPANNTLHMPGSLVFTCLSHDIIAHEVTHAILDGMHYYYNEPTNPDVLAFHEAFADIVALFQHFTFPDVLKHQIAKTRGDLSSQNLLGELAQEFGAAIGSYGSLRDALGEIDKETSKWKMRDANPLDYSQTIEPHKRGSILVAAIFEAFLTIYKNRIADLLRIATDGSGILPQGELHPDLINRLSKEASKAASHVLTMCIRALDYCPPVDITFGEYLRAIVTADFDLLEEDSRNYRLAFIDAFRRRGIYPSGIRNLSEESLIYQKPQIKTPAKDGIFAILSKFLKEYRDEVYNLTNRRSIYQVSKKYLGGNSSTKGLHQRLRTKAVSDSKLFETLTGLVFDNNNFQSLGIRTSNAYNGPSFRVQNLRVVNRTGPNGNQINFIIFSIMQRAGVTIRNEEEKYSTYIPNEDAKSPENSFEFWGGCTFIFDLNSLTLKYTIPKPLLDTSLLSIDIRELHQERILTQYDYQNTQLLDSQDEFNMYFGFGVRNQYMEPFAFLHSH